MLSAFSRLKRSSSSSAKADDVAYYRHIPWGSMAGVLMVVFTYFGVGILAGLLMTLYSAASGSDVHEMNEGTMAVLTAQFVYVLLVESLTIGVLALYMDRIRASWRLLGFRRPQLTDLGFAGIGFAVYFVLVIVAMAVVGVLVPLDTNQEQALGFDPEAVTGFAAQAMTFISLVILPPLVEETLFRGFLFGGMRARFRFVAAAIVTSLIFAIPHMLQGADGKVLWVGGIDTFVLSLVLCYLREKSGGLWAPIGVHMLKNGLAFVSLFILQVQ